MTARPSARTAAEFRRLVKALYGGSLPDAAQDQRVDPATAWRWANRKSRIPHAVMERLREKAERV